MTKSFSLHLSFLRRRAAPEFSRGFQPTERLENIPSSRQRRLNSIVADATWKSICAHRGLKPTGRLENIPSSRQRRLNSIVADATWKSICAHRGLKPTAKFRRRSAAGNENRVHSGFKRTP